MNILLANRQLTGYTGTEIVTRDLALAFKSLGHAPVVYSPRLGTIARQISSAGVAVHRDVRSIEEAPAIIHGNHPKQTLDALLRFPQVAAVGVCHDGGSAYDEPFYHPRILRYVGVDRRCRRRIERQPRIPPARIAVVPNAVDLHRFRPRGPLPARPSTALVFSNAATPRTHLPPIEEACRRAGLRFDVVGSGAGTQMARPETVLPHYDVVFAKARCALEAMAVGNAVILCDHAGAGPMVTLGAFDDLRRKNFGYEALVNPLTADVLTAELRRYDPDDAARVAARVRAEADLGRAATQWVELYEDIAAEAAAMTMDFAQEQDALLDYLEQHSYEARVDWELAQVARIARIPVVGAPLQTLITRCIHWMRSQPR